MKTFWRIVEWVMTLVWPVIAYKALFTYDLTTDGLMLAAVFPLSLLVPMVGPVVVRLFSAPVDTQKRFALVALLVFGVALAVTCQDDYSRLV